MLITAPNYHVKYINETHFSVSFFHLRTMILLFLYNMQVYNAVLKPNYGPGLIVLFPKMVMFFLYRI